MPTLVSNLEKINQIIDLCIDRELFEYVASDGEDSIFELSEEAKKFIRDLQKEKGKKTFPSLEYPVLSICLPDTLIRPRGGKWEKGPIYLKNSNALNLEPYLLKHWSNLFWAKALRAELQRNNKGEWLHRYDDLVLLLEVCMPELKERKSNKVVKDWDITLFTFLMELSAIAQGEASYGYAERSRRLVDVLYPISDVEKEPQHRRHNYDRWIWYNMGLAYQHIGRNQKAVLEYNLVISEFFSKERKKEGVNDDDGVLEFLLNIYPSILQRAAINLKLQLGYHALQTLADPTAEDWLEKLCEDNARFCSQAANELKMRSELLRVEALLQVERTEDAESQLQDIYPKIFPKRQFSASSLPPYKPMPKATQTQLVEQIVSWSLQEDDGIKGCRDEILSLLRANKKARAESWINEVGEKAPKIKKKVERFVSISMAVQDTYWRWAKGNEFDERIYFSKWAQFLRLSAEILDKLAELINDLCSQDQEVPADLEESARLVIDSSMKLYCFRALDRKRLTKKLHKFKSDDLPDFVGGLSDYYRQMSKILLKSGEYEDGRFREMAGKSFDKACIQASADREASNEVSLVQLLKKDHLELLDALDEWEQEFGENRRISSLKRCNQRLAWVEEKENPLRDRCEVCLPETKEAEEAFCGLLECVKGYPSGGNNKEFDSYPNGNDYENIILEAEEKLVRQLRTSSQPEPKRHALRFFGLQRWNSLTPAQGRSVGGGYFIYQTDKSGKVDLGIAIDPGFDFVRNLFRMGFSLRDVDIVLISHAHPDHLWDFESLVQLLHELNDKTGITHRLNVVLTLGIYRRIEHIINNPELRRFMDPLVIDSRKEIDKEFFERLCRQDDDARIEPYFGFYARKGVSNRGAETDIRWCPVLPGIPRQPQPDIEIWPTRAYHDDYSERSDSFGFLIKFKKIPSLINTNKPLCFGYTGDTKWVGNDLYNEGCPVRNDFNEFKCKDKCKISGGRWEVVSSQYKDCDVVLMHIGSLIEHKKGRRFNHYCDARRCEEMIRKTNHPYLMGLMRFLGELHSSAFGSSQEREKLILVGEFGEELRGGIRTDIVRRLKGGIVDNWPILPVDVGLDILLHEFDFKPDKDDGKEKGFKFLCVLCDQYHDVGRVDYVRFGQDEGIFYVCRTCKKAFPDDVRQTKLQHLYEIGRELRTADRI